MGPACGVLGTAAVVALATLLLILHRLAHKEYTEEIERLRQEVISSRERSGVFMSLENYTRLVHQLEQQERRLAQRTADIAALNNKMDVKEKMCQQLVVKLERRTLKPRNSTRVVCDTAHWSAGGRLPPSAEPQLSDEPKTAVPVADEPYDGRLSRKRPAENENDQIMRDFRLKFNQNMALLENSIQTFSQSYYKFNTGFQESLGSHLEKGVVDMSMLSEKMSSLIDSQDEIIQGLERISSEMVHTSQHMIQDQLRTARKAADEEANKLHMYWAEVALPTVQGLVRSLELQKGETKALKRLLTEQFAQYLPLFEKHVSDQKELCTRIKDNLLHFTLQQSQKAEKLRNFLSAVKDEENTAAAEIASILNGVTHALEAKKLHSAKFAERVSRVGEEFSRDDEASGKLSRVIVEDIDRQAKKDKEQLEMYQDHSEEIATGIDGIIDRSTSCMSNAERHLQELETGVHGALTSGEAAWRDHYKQTEEDLRVHSEHLNSGLEAELQQTSLLASTVHSAAESHEAALEKQRLDLSDFVRGRQDDAEAQCSHVTEWSHKITSDVRERDQDLERFIGEDLRMDFLADAAPQDGPRYPPPTTLSSREEFLEKIRAHRQLMADSKTAEGRTSGIRSIIKAKAGHDAIREYGKRKPGTQ